MTFLEILVEGGSDVPVVKEILKRHFGLQEHLDFRIHPHKGKGKLPKNPLERPDPKHRGLLDQLPAKLRGYAYLPEEYCVIVLVDADDDNCKDLKSDLLKVYQDIIPHAPRILFRIAIEETESWFIADKRAIKIAYPNAKLNKIPNTPYDSIIGSWECLADALGKDPRRCVGEDKKEWASKISPYLDLDSPNSPSLKAFIDGVERLLMSDKLVEN